VAVAGDPAGAREHCAPLSDVDLRADCLTAAVERLGADPHAAALCAEIPAGPHRDECNFQRAEASRDAAACADAGRFEQDCRMHLWTRTLLTRVTPGSTPAEVVALAEPLRAAAGFGDDDPRPWIAAFRLLHSRRRPLDRRDCAAAGERAALCREAGRQVYADRLNNARDTGRYPCAGGGTPDDLLPDLPADLQTAPDTGLTQLRQTRDASGDLCSPRGAPAGAAP